MKLLLVNLYPAKTIARYLLSSYVLKSYISRHFKTNRAEVIVLNYNENTSYFKIAHEIIEQHPDFIGYSCYSWNMEKILKVANEVKKRAECIHIFGGPEISLKTIEELEYPFLGDYYIIGEGEKKLCSLLHFLSTNSAGSPPDGIAFWEAGKLKYKEDKGYLQDLDEVPPVYSGGFIEEHLYAKQQAFLETQRGCRFKCRYCVYHKNLPGVAYYSLERVQRELQYLIVEKKVAAIRFLDSIFTSELQRAKEIVRFLISLKERSDVKLPWIYWEFTYQSTDEEFLKLLAQLRYGPHVSNCAELAPKDRAQHYSELLKDYTAINCVGIQSFNKESLRAIGRPGVGMQSFTKFMNLINQHNLVLKIDLILGLPFETIDSFFQGIEFLLHYLRNADHVLNIHCLQILPGSELENLCGDYEIKYRNDFSHAVYQTPALSESELNEATKLVAILFRIINSPLRKHFYSAIEHTGHRPLTVLKNIKQDIMSSKDLGETRIVQAKSLNDEYWNDDVFKELPSQWISDYLNGYVKKSRYYEH